MMDLRRKALTLALFASAFLLLQLAALCADPTWTVIVYGNGDNSLSAQLVEDIKKMEQVGSSATFRIIVEADFDASNDDNDDAGLPDELSKGTSRFLVQKSKDEESLTSKPAMRLPELNHDEQKVLKDFVSWAIKKYPADRYGVIFWDHGGQWEGFGGDEQDGTLDYAEGIRTGKIRQALTEALRDAPGKAKFDFVAFDTCLMGGMEVLEDFDGLAELFIACPEIDYGDGWNYAKTLGWLKSNPAASMRSFGVQETEFWKQLHMTEENEGDRVLAAHCAYDMAKYPAVRQAFKDFAGAMAREISPRNLSIPKQRRKTVEYSLSLSDDIRSSDYIDLGQFARGFAEDHATPPALKARSEALANAIDELVIAKALGEEKAGASGLSVWYPIKRDPVEDDDDDDDADEARAAADKEARDKFQGYKALSLFKSSRWPDYIQLVWKFREDFNDEPELSIPGAKSLNASIEKGLSLPVSVDSGKGAFLLHASLVLDKDKGKFIYLGQILRKEIEGPGKYSLSWSCKALSLVDAQGMKVFLGAFPKDESGHLWFSYAKYKKAESAKPSDVILLIQVKDGEAKLLKMLDAASEDLAPAPIAARPGGSISPLYVMEKRKGSNPDKWKQSLVPSGFSLTVPKEGLQGMKVDMGTLRPGKYNIEIQAEDINGEMSGIVEYKLNLAP